MKKIIFIGSAGCGKTTLAQKIRGEQLIYKKTQEVNNSYGIIDTPGEYLQTRNYYGILSELALTANIVALFSSGAEEKQDFPPLFSKFFVRECIGIVTKIDIATPEKVSYNKKQLQLAGCKKLFFISAVTGAGMDELLQFLHL